ncbi:cupin domain-containing protein [Ramlibacter sp. XY19]|uniref:cupin domain-containing protein n=1 Tax=Ramlibacter paludis TaxID=2908000 RepID=UPI0023DC3A1F|nr:cupin domain-containing protein [Ramlibacter paludis]MCG2594609.1 cupin domain-containing protein [Ramlibacter paludis]
MSNEPGNPVDDSLIQRVRRRVLDRVAHDVVAQHLTVRGGAEGWQPFLPGIRCKVLYEQAGTLSYLLELAPGAVLPGHRHSQDEECLVLRGRLRIGDQLVVEEGDFHVGLAGVLHAPITTDAGALIFLRGAAPDGRECI